MDTQNTNLSTPFKLLSQAFNLFTSRFSAIAGVVTPMLVVYIISQVLSFYARGGKGSPAIVLSSALFSLVWLIVSIIGFIALVRTVNAIIAGTTVQPESAYREGAKLISSVAVVGLMSAATGILGFFAFIIPGVLLSIYFTFAVPSVILDGKKGFDAILTSVHLVRGRWAKVFGYMLVVGIFGFAVSLAAVFVSEVLFADFALLKAVVATAVSLLVVGPVSSLFQLLFFAELKKTVVPMTDLDRATYKRNIITAASVGAICFAVVVFLVYKSVAYFLSHPELFFNY